MMFGHSLTAVIIACAGVLVVAIGGARLTRRDSWYFALRKPAWQPPDWLFGPVWSLIFLLTAASFVLCWDRLREFDDRTRLVGLFALNAGLNVLWSHLFFVRHRPELALMESIVFAFNIAHLLLSAYQLDTRAGWALLPYLAWVMFATVLNGVILRLNPHVRSVRATGA